MRRFLTMARDTLPTSSHTRIFSAIVQPSLSVVKSYNVSTLSKSKKFGSRLWLYTLTRITFFPLNFWGPPSPKILLLWPTNGARYQVVRVVDGDQLTDWREDASLSSVGRLRVRHLQYFVEVFAIFSMT
jgi:hypothetical protein